ncbi:MAG: hypothetical protein ABSC16_06145 [Candidatus Dormibacteria bacterium]
MRRSSPIPSATVSMSAPVSSQSWAISLMKLILVARKALEPYLMVVFAVLAGYPLYILLLGPQRVSGALQGYGFVARPTSFLIPSRFELISGSSTVFDSSVYIGVPLLILAVGPSPSGCAATPPWWRRR